MLLGAPGIATRSKDTIVTRVEVITNKNQRVDDFLFRHPLAARRGETVPATEKPTRLQALPESELRG